MLKKLRSKKTAKKVWLILAIIIVPAFVLWGSGSLIRSKQEASYAGIIFGRKVSLLEYKDALEAVKNAAIMQFGENLSAAEKSLNLQYQAWIRIMLLSEAKKRKITASDREVIELIESYPYFQRNGRFNSGVYSEILRYVFRTQPRIFEEQARQNLILSKLSSQLVNGIRLNEEEIKTEYIKANEEISLYYIAGSPADFAKDITPKEEELKDYFSRNSLQFKQPVSFNLDYAAVDSEDKMKELVLRLHKNSDLNKIGRDLGIAVKETGLLSQTDPIPGIGWSPKILALVSKLKPGQFSQPIHLDKYYYIFRLKEIKEAYIPDFEKLKDKIREVFIREKSTKLAKEKLEGCLAKLKELYKLNPKEIDFNKFAKEWGLRADSTENFKYGSYIEGIGASDILWMKARELKEGEFSDIISVPSGFYIIKLKNHIPIDEKKFEGEKAKFSENLLSQKKQEYFAQFIEELSRKSGLPLASNLP